jgi:hypothetical protein
MPFTDDNGKVIAMKLRMICCLALIILAPLFVLPSALFGDGNVQSEVEQFMTSYFQALQTGDVQFLLSVLAPPLLNNRRLLLERNTAYPDYLRNYYKNATFNVASITASEHGVFTVDSEIFFGDHPNPMKSRFFLKEMDHMLKLFNEIAN